MEVMKKVLQKLEDCEFTVNLTKCRWATKETDYLEFHLTTNGIKPIPSKVEVIIKIARPTTTKQVRSFIGLINYYKDMWLQRAHILSPLMELCKFTWENQHEIAFQKIKKL